MKKYIHLIVFLFASVAAFSQARTDVQLIQDNNTLIKQSPPTPAKMGAFNEEIIASKLNVNQLARITASGTNTYTSTISPTIATYQNLKVFINFTNGNTGASTIDIGGVGAVALVKNASTPLASGDLLANTTYLFSFNGSAFQLVGDGGGGGGFTGTPGSVPFVGASTNLTQDNTNLFWDNTNKFLGINTASAPVAPLSVGTPGIILSPLAEGSIRISSAIANFGLPANGITDGSVITAGGTVSYASFRGIANLGTANSFGHVVSFQASPQINTSFPSVISDVSGITSTAVLTGSGSILNYKALNIADVVVGSSGTVNDSRGLHIDDITKGVTNNYAIYTNLGDIRFGQFAGLGTGNVGFDNTGKLIVGSGGGGTSPGGANRSVQFNNSSSFDGFGNWDGATLDIAASTYATTGGGQGLVLRESNATLTNQFRQHGIKPGVFKTTGATGNFDINAFISDNLVDATCTVTFYVNGVKSDGSESYASTKTATFRKDGTADAVIVGTVTTNHEAKDEPLASSSISIALVSGFDNIRCSFSTGDADSYVWSIFYDITYSIN